MTGGDSFNRDEDSRPVWQEIEGQLVTMVIDRARKLVPHWLISVKGPTLASYVWHRLNRLVERSTLNSIASETRVPPLSRLLTLRRPGLLQSQWPLLSFIWPQRQRKLKDHPQGLTLLTSEWPPADVASKKEFPLGTLERQPLPQTPGEKLPELGGGLVNPPKITVGEKSIITAVVTNIGGIQIYFPHRQPSVLPQPDPDPSPG
jgi:hypothetical protein